MDDEPTEETPEEVEEVPELEPFDETEIDENPVLNPSPGG
jgi:hypothetical protein